MTHYLIDQSYFTNKEDLMDAATQHVYENWSKMSHTDRDVLNLILRHSKKFGAAQLTHSQIENGVGKSNATVRRSVRKLHQLGIIDRIHYIQPIMSGLGPNIYAIKPFEELLNIN